MSNFSKVNAVWSDLNVAYLCSGNGMTKIDFVKRLLMYDRGEAAFRNLINKVSEGDDTASSEEVNSLVQKLQLARKKVAELDDANEQLNDFNQLFTSSLKPVRQSFYDFTANSRVDVISLSEQVKTGSLIPVRKISKEGIIEQIVDEYMYVIDTPGAIFNLIQNARKGSYNPNIVRALSFCAAKSNTGEIKFVTPCIITTTETIEHLQQLGFRVKKTADVFDGNTLTVKLHRVKDNYSTIGILTVDES